MPTDKQQDGSTTSTSIDLEENDLKPNPTDFQETGASDGFKINIAAWKKELFYLSLALSMLASGSCQHPAV